MICVHNVHWCVERLLRNATYDWQNLSYKDGFEEIFKKYSSKHKDQIPPKLVGSIEKLNHIRNEVEHKGIYPDMQTLRDLLPSIYDFIDWLARREFNTTLDIFSIPSIDENAIFSEFSKWIEKKINENQKLEVNQKSEQCEYMFICLIPSSYSEGLVDFSSDPIKHEISSKMPSGIGISAPNPAHHSQIEHYLRDCTIIEYSQTYANPKYVKQYNETMGEELKFHPNGLIYLCIIYHYSEKENPSFNLDSILEGKGYRVNMETIKRKYGISIDIFHPGMLEDILKLLCFAKVVTS